MERIPVIKTSDLSIGYILKGGQKKCVHDALDLNLYPGEVTCLLGLNGAGKSTLLRTLCGFQPPLGGEIELMGKPLNSYSQGNFSRLVGVVLTEKTNAGGITVYELVSLGRHPYTGFFGQLRQEDRRIIEESLAAASIAHKAYNYVSELSDGERQKAMIAKALAQETPVIFLDEPTAFLDFPSKVEIMQLLHHLTRTTNKTIFLSTHDLELALQIADKIWLMDKVKGISTGTPEDLALSGYLSGFFARKGIVFDMETGLFRIDNRYDREIHLTGSGQKYAMVRKALLRNGIHAGCEIESESRIDAGETVESPITLYLSGNPPRQVASVEELLMCLES